MNQSERQSKTEAQWQAELTPEQFHICRQKGTERAFTGQYWDEHRSGNYYCVACGQRLFDAHTKYDSGTGWPSFWAPVAGEVVTTANDDSIVGRPRTEVLCSGCGSHLGHIFSDGPAPTGQRYCMNSAALKFEPVEKTDQP